jgi:hypothetical protein
MPDVRLVDLEVIKRYSLAVRRDAVPADELLAALDASRDMVLAAIGAPAKRTAKTKVAEAEANRASRSLA